jgi:hypothetical protein
MRPDALGRFGAELPTRDLEVVVGLHVQPELRAVPEIDAETQGRVGGDPPSVAHDVGDPVRRDADRESEPALRQPVLLEKLLAEHLTRRDRRELVWRDGSSVIVDHRDLVGMAVGSAKRRPATGR